MGTRRYNQFCGLATALDLAGDRWTPLVIRELVGGPRRFSDLRVGLPGVPDATLSRSLTRLVELDIVTRAPLSPSVSVRVYRLTPGGEELADALTMVARWGAKHLSERPPVQELRASWFPLALKAAFVPEHATPCTIEFHLDERVFHASIRDQQVAVHDGPVPNTTPDVVLRMPLTTALEFGLGRVDRLDPQRESAEGPPELLAACFRMFSALRPKAPNPSPRRYDAADHLHRSPHR